MTPEERVAAWSKDAACMSAVRYEPSVLAMIRAAVAEERDRGAMSDERHETFRRELEWLINRHSMENTSNTPDWILAQYLMACLAAFDAATQQREKWYGRAARSAETQCGDVTA